MRMTISSLAGGGPVADADRRRALQDHADLRDFSGELLARANEEWDTGPTPVLNLQTEPHERLGVGLRIHALDLPVALVLAADVAVRAGVGDRPEEVELCVANRVGVAAGRRRLHRHEREGLKQVVLNYVAEAADGVVEAAAVVDAEVLGHGDLHRLDVAPVPDRLEQRVRKAQVGEVLHRLLAEEVVDPVDLILLQDLMDLIVQIFRGLQVVSERLLDYDAGALGQVGLAEVLDDGGEERRRDLEVEDRELGAGELFLQALEGVVVGVVARDVAEQLGEALEDLLVDFPTLCIEAGLNGLASVPMEVLVGPLVASDADHRHLERPVVDEVVQRLEGHLPRQVARDPEDRQRVARWPVVRTG